MRRVSGVMIVMLVQGELGSREYIFLVTGGSFFFKVIQLYSLWFIFMIELNAC